MLSAAYKLDSGIKHLITVVCILALIGMVYFTVYTVVMRYVFLDAPFWGDTLTMFFNIWMVLLALVITVRDRAHISMTMLYEFLPPIVGFSCEFLWTLIIAAFGVFLMIWGFDAAWNVPGLFWEFNYMPKKYPMMILPICGVLTVAAAVVVMLEDIARARRGDIVVHAHELQDVEEMRKIVGIQMEEVEEKQGAR
jgi:TRAP-type C4-dicarboxylate transport system permease small subunit